MCVISPSIVNTIPERKRERKERAFDSHFRGRAVTAAAADAAQFVFKSQLSQSVRYTKE